MALNWVVLTPDGTGPLPLPDEKIFATYDDVRLEYTAGNGYPGSGANFLVKRGKLFVSSHRLVYLTRAFLDASTAAAAAAGSSAAPHAPAPPSSSGGGGEFQNLSVPLRSLSDPALQQPWFGTNHVTMKVTPVPGGHLSAEIGHAAWYFDKGGAFEMYSVLATVMQRAIPEFQMVPPTVAHARATAEAEPLPVYPGGHGAPPPQAPPSSGPEFPPPPATEAAPFQSQAPYPPPPQWPNGANVAAPAQPQPEPELPPPYLGDGTEPPRDVKRPL